MEDALSRDWNSAGRLRRALIKPARLEGLLRPLWEEEVRSDSALDA